MSEYDGMDLSDFGIKKYDMRFLGRPRLDHLGGFTLGAVVCDTLSAFIYLLLLPPFITSLLRRWRRFCIAAWRNLERLIYQLLPFLLGRCI